MSDLLAFLGQKADALRTRKARIEAGELGPNELSAQVSAEGGSGVRRIRIRDFQLITDSPPDFAGYDLGPTSPELQLGSLGSCLVHSFLIQAAALGIAVETVDVEVTGILDARAGHESYPEVPISPHNIQYVLRIKSSASNEEIAKLHANVQRFCPILNLLRQPQTIVGRIECNPQTASSRPR